MTDDRPHIKVLMEDVHIAYGSAIIDGTTWMMTNAPHSELLISAKERIVRDISDLLFRDGYMDFVLRPVGKDDQQRYGPGSQKLSAEFAVAKGFTAQAQAMFDKLRSGRA